MNTRSFYSFILISCTFISTAMAQANLLNARVPQEIGQLNEQQVEANDETPLAYGFIDDRDILWSKTIWEIVDLDERINFPYYYPTDTLNLGPDRRSLFHVLKKNLRNGKIKEVYDDDYFQSKLTYQEILDKLVAIDTLEAGIEQLNAGEELDPQYINRRTITAAEIRQYRVKGTWYVNKRLGELKYRLLGIAPVAPDVYTLDLPEDEQDLVELFWVWFPDAREELHEMKVFNQKNSATPISFDHILNARRFSSIIYKIENIYGNRDVSQYVKGNALFQVLESNRIKEEIRSKEGDMWNY